MKYFRFILQPIRKVFFHMLFLKFLLGCFWLCSCEDNVEQPSYSSRMVFNSEIRSSWTPSTRSVTDINDIEGTVAILQGNNNPFYLHTLYTDSIASPLQDIHQDSAILTRATPVTNDNMYNTFGISAYAYIGSWNESRLPNYFYNSTATKNGNAYTLPSTYYWPGVSYKLKFFAYAPVGKGQYLLSESDYPGSPTLDVTIPGDVNDQADLLVAKTEELNGNHGNAVPLAFHHALTAVRFECGSDMQEGIFKSISLKNVYSKGVFNLETLSWNHIDSQTSFSQTLNKATSGRSGETLTSDAQTFMMIPQTLPEGAQLEVVFTDNTGTDHTLTAEIRGTVWPMGKTVIYKISRSSINWTYTLDVSSLNDFTYAGGTQQYGVTSYRQSSKGVKEAVAWTAQYSEDGIRWTDTRPEWLTAFTTSGSGGVTAQSYNATVKAQIGIDDSPHTRALRNASPKGTQSAPYNLANQTNGGATDENTANCYVVDAPGYYSFPLVYGNAIKDGRPNTPAYTSTVKHHIILSPFINHTGNGITDPYISNNSDCNPAGVKLVWQDEPNLITAIKYNSGLNGGFISFKVDKDYIRQGNAVIAVKDEENRRLWSWHIWVTDENISNTIALTNRSNYTYHFMPVNLGWCDGNATTYAERSCKVKFTAEGLSKEIIVKQAAQTVTYGNNAPYYQWGRKDPFVASNGIDNGNKIRYGYNEGFSADDPKQKDLSSGKTCIMNYILNPDVMQAAYSGDNFYYNLWNVNCGTSLKNDNPVVKTVYDPCPVGFSLPVANAFSRFSKTNVEDDAYTAINGSWNKGEKGVYFYTDRTNTQTIFIPALGYREYGNNTRIIYPGTNGYYWLANPNGTAEGRSTEFGYTYMSIFDWDSPRAYGFNIRPMQN